jgi:hypothetical protein
MNQVSYAAERLAFVANGAVPVNVPLISGEAWYTRDHRMVLQGDGNLVIYRNDNNAVTFYSNSATQSCHWSNCYAIFQGDGNFVLYNGTTAYWHTNTYGYNGVDYEFIVARANGIPAIRKKSDGSIIWPTTAHYGTYPNYYGYPYRDISASQSGNNIQLNTKLDISEIGVQENNATFNWLMIPGHVEYQIHLVTLSPYVDRYLSWILYDNECSNSAINSGVSGCGGYGFYTSGGGYSAMANIYKPKLDQSLRARSSTLLTESFKSLVRTWGPYPANDSNAALYESTLAGSLVAEYNANASLSVFDMEARNPECLGGYQWCDEQGFLEGRRWKHVPANSASRGRYRRALFLDIGDPGVSQSVVQVQRGQHLFPELLQFEPGRMPSRAVVASKARDAMYNYGVAGGSAA